MVVAVDGRGLVAGNAVAGVDTLHQPQIGERLERPVHGCDPDRSARLAELVVDVLRAQAAVLAAEQLDDGRPCSAAAIARFVECEERVIRPRHGASVSSSV